MESNISFSPIFKDLLNIIKSIFVNFVYYGGRDSGKSWAIAYHLLIISMVERNHLILCAKGTQNSIEDSSKSLLESLINLNNWSHLFEITNNSIICKLTGSKFIFKGLQKVNRLRSLEGITICWIEEANIDTTEKTFEALIPTIRKDNSKLILSFNPALESDYVYQRFILNTDPDLDSVHFVNYPDNPFISEKSKREIEYLKNRNYEKYLHVYEGQLITEIQGALWNRDLFKYLSNDEKTQLKENNYGNLERIIVAIDPSITSKMTSDACGIVVVGKYRNLDRFIVLEDASRISTPNEWADIALSLYYRYKADRIVGEMNQGGDMIKTIIKNKDNRAAYKGVYASRGKIARAEPIASLYEEGKVIHLERFVGLEYEQVTYTGTPKEKSPNALDALVWGLSELSSKKSRAGYESVSPVGIRF